jgi:hypothetical protein
MDPSMDRIACKVDDERSDRFIELCARLLQKKVLGDSVSWKEYRAAVASFGQFDRKGTSDIGQSSGLCKRNRFGGCHHDMHSIRLPIGGSDEHRGSYPDTLGDTTTFLSIEARVG